MSKDINTFVLANSGCKGEEIEVEMKGEKEKEADGGGEE